MSEQTKADHTRSEVERMRGQLAACNTAALDKPGEPLRGADDPLWSRALEAVQLLNVEAERLRVAVASIAADAEREAEKLRGSIHEWDRGWGHGEAMVAAKLRAALVDTGGKGKELSSPHVLLRPRLYPDGDQWCMLYGNDLQEGVAGFGGTPALAAAAFDDAWQNQRCGMVSR